MVCGEMTPRSTPQRNHDIISANSNGVFPPFTGIKSAVRLPGNGKTCQVGGSQRQDFTLETAQGYGVFPYKIF